MIRLSLLLIAMCAIPFFSRAQEYEVIPLWEKEAPGALGTADHDRPTLTIYPGNPEKRMGSAMVICPGGGYGGLAAHEGKDYALWLAGEGVTSFVLKYRLGSHGYRHPRMLEDVSRAIRLVRANAGRWGVDSSRVGVMGSSAGGHLASTALTHFDSGKKDATDKVDQQSSRPDLGILCYPVITMGKFTHTGSRNNLLGTEPSEELLTLLSNEKQVTTNTPPTFVWHTVEDKAVPVENALEFAAALQKAGVPFDLHIYQHGKHGIGLAGGHPWTKDCLHWLRVQKFIK